MRVVFCLLIYVATAVAQPSVPEPVSVVVVLDRSHLMKGEPLDAGKEMVEAIARTLRDIDMLAVVAFDGDARVVARLQRASNRRQVVADVNRIESGGSADVVAALGAAQRVLDGVRGAKHVILYSAVSDASYLDL